MKTLVLAINKGGVGKSSTAVQFAHYLALNKQRVLILDMDHQANTTKAIKLSGKAVVSKTSTMDVLTTGADGLEPGDFVIVPAVRELFKLEKRGMDQHNVFANNLSAFLASVSNRFDICIMDTNGNPDIRVTASLVVADFVLSPIQLNQEALDGIGDLLNDLKGIKRINPKLQHLGIMPNMVQSTPFQKANFKQIATHYSSLLIPTADGKDFIHIPNRSVIPEAQAAGVPIWEIKKTAARDAWRELEPYFKVIATRIGLEF